MKFAQVGLSNSEKSMLARAKKLALSSRCIKRHGCIIVKGGRVIGSGVNSPRNSWKIFDIIPPRNRTLHAEEAAILSVGGDTQGAVAYVARLGRSGSTRMSKPCESCRKILVDAGIKKVVYTIESQISFED